MGPEGTSASPSLANHHRQASLPPPAFQPFSIKDQFNGTSVLLTGATGFVGSVVLEQLLRCCPGLKTVYVLCRGKKGATAEHRIRRLLHSGLFHCVRDHPHLRAKVCIIKGDLRSADLGMLPLSTRTATDAGSDANKAEQARLHFHPSAEAAKGDASVAARALAPEHLEAASPPSQQQQQQQQQQQLQQAGGISPPHLPFSSTTSSSGKLEAPTCTAAKATGGQGNMWDAEGHHTREGDMTDLAAEQRLVVIHCAARIALEDPLQVTLAHNYYGMKHLLEGVSTLPGLCGVLHVSTAFVNCCKPFLPEGTAEEQVYPLKFGDREVDHGQVVADLMKLKGDAAEARASYLADIWGFPNSYVLGKNLTERLLCDAHCKPAPVAIVRPTLVSALAGPPYPGFTGNLAGPSGYAIAFAMGFFGRNAPCWSPYNHLDNVPADCVSSCILGATAALLACIDVSKISMPRSDTCLESSGPSGAAPPTPPPCSASKAQPVWPAAAPAPRATAAHPGDDLAASTPGAARHAAAAPDLEERAGSGAGAAPAAASAGPAAQVHAGGRVGSERGARGALGSADGPWMLANQRQTLDGTQEVWHEVVHPQETYASDTSNSSGPTPQLPQAPLATSHSPVAVFHCGSTCIQPLSHAESYALAYDFYSKNPPKARIMYGNYVEYIPDYKPVLWKSKLAKRWTHFKIGSLAMLLSCFGQDQQARRLRGGYTMWDQTLDPKNDFRLSFSVRNSLVLESLITPEERTLFPLVWRGEWLAFIATYMAAVMRLFLKQDVPRFRRDGKQQHSFVYIPNTRVM